MAVVPSFMRSELARPVTCTLTGWLALFPDAPLAYLALTCSGWQDHGLPAQVSHAIVPSKPLFQWEERVSLEFCLVKGKRVPGVTHQG